MLESQKLHDRCFTAADVVLKVEISSRAKRFFEGDMRVEDLDRIFLYLRDRSVGCASLREIGDFVAHRDERKKGPVTQIVQDFFDSSDVYFPGLMGNMPPFEKMKKASEANFRMAPDKLIKTRLGIRRAAAKAALDQALKKFEVKEPLTDREAMVLEYFVARMIWRPAFTAEGVLSDLKRALTLNKILERFSAMSDLCERFVTLYVIALMHGVTILYAEGRKALLRAEVDRQRKLVVRALIEYSSMPKPTSALFCVFYTTLGPDTNCADHFLSLNGPWECPIELRPDCKLYPLMG